MNVNLRYEADFAAAIYYPTEPPAPALQLNWYSLKLSMTTATPDNGEINLAMDRVRIWIYEEMAHTVFVADDLKDQVTAMTKLGMNVTTLPEDPLDQIINMMLYCKLTAIMCGRIIIDEIELNSKLGDQIWYRHSEGDHLGPFAESGWWHQPSLQRQDIDSKTKNSKLTKIQNIGWKKYNLEWPTAKESNNATVVFADFKHDDD